jgi:hypothetical protein
MGMDMERRDALTGITELIHMPVRHTDITVRRGFRAACLSGRARGIADITDAVGTGVAGTDADITAQDGMAEAGTDRDQRRMRVADTDMAADIVVGTAAADMAEATAVDTVAGSMAAAVGIANDINLPPSR